MELDLEKTMAAILAGCHEVVPEDAMRAKVANALAKQRPLRIKTGIDPTSPDVHLGHLVPYGKMRQLQDLGHIGVVVIGDYTARIGDPSGKDSTRPALTAEYVHENAQKYMEQLYTVLDRTRTEVRWQSEWYDKFDLAATLRLLQEMTLGKTLQHDTFRTRYEQNRPLGLHELCYPLLQGYDSVAIEADIEMGDPAQKFNILVGRDLMERRGMEPQVALLMPTLTGLDGVEKMSKSLGNHVGVLMSAEDQYGRTMSMPDRVMENWHQLFLGLTGEALAAAKAQIEADPMGAKRELAHAVVARFHGPAAADAAADDFRRKFSERTLELGDIPEVRLADFTPPSATQIIAKTLGLSNTEARRLVKGGGVKLDNERVVDAEAPLTRPGVLKVGKKKWLRLIG
jgi:tyrosyl-tRNA synthetase